VKSNFRLVSQEFEIGTILTPTMKLRRHQAKEAFSDLIEELYRTSGQ
jgi:long-subunit acyl-CoA synthetase (AMP-forming)